MHNRMRRKLCPHFENLFWKKLVLTPCHIPSNCYRVKSESISPTHTHSTTLQFSYIYKKIMKSCLQMYFIFFPHMNDFGKKSPRRLRHPPAQSSVKQLRHYYSLSCPWWKQCHSYASVGNKGVHSSRVIQLFVSWLSLQTQKAGDELMFTKTAET